MFALTRRTSGLSLLLDVFGSSVPRIASALLVNVGHHWLVLEEPSICALVIHRTHCLARVMVRFYPQLMGDYGSASTQRGGWLQIIWPSMKRSLQSAKPLALLRLTLRRWLITDPYWLITGADYGSSDCIRHSPCTFLSSPSVRTAATNPGHGTKELIAALSRVIFLFTVLRFPLAAYAAGGVSSYETE